MARKTIGLLLDWSNFYYQNTIMKGIYDFCKSEDINLFCFEGGALNAPTEFESQRNLIYKLVSKKRIDGIIILTPTISHFSNQTQILEFYKKFENIPKLSIAYEVENIPSLVLDNNIGMIELLEHLINHHQYKKFGFIKGTEFNKDAEQRYNLFIETIKKYDIPLSDQLFYQGDFFTNTGNEAVKYFLQQNKKIDAIIASNDLMAIGAIEELNKNKIIVPDEIAVTGFDNVKMCININPPLTTVSQPIYNIGKMAAKNIYKLINGEKIPLKQYIPTELIIRESCKCQFHKATEIMKNEDFINIKIDEKMIQNIYNKILKNKYFFKNYTSNLLNKKVFLKIIKEFINAVKQNNQKKYMRYFNNILINSNFSTDDLYIIMNFITVLKTELIPEIINPENKNTADNILYNSLKKLSQFALKFGQYKNEDIDSYEIIMNQLRRELFVNLEKSKQFQDLSKSLKELNINEFYIFLYDENTANNKKSKMIFSSNKKNKSDLTKNEVIIDSNILLPDNIMNKTKPVSFIIEALKNYGFIVLELNQFKYLRLYLSLSEIISTSLHNAILFEKLHNQKNEIKNNFEQIRKAMGAFIETMALTVEVRDPYTAGHQRRVSDLARAIATKMKLDTIQIESVRMAGIIHDLGKIYIPAEILNKPGKLLDLEFNLIMTHPQVAYDILKNIIFPWPIAEIVYQHHEKMDGSGYPNGLKGDQIKLEARILSVADVVEAVSSHRPYRPALGIEKALEIIKETRGKYLDPDVVDACLELFLKDGFKFKN